MSQYTYTRKPNWPANAHFPAKLTEASCILSNSATTCTRAAGSFITDGVTAGMYVTGPGISSNTTVASVNSDTSLTLSTNTTSTAAGTVELLFAPAVLPITYAAPEGWIQPGVGGNGGVAIQSASWAGNVVTVNATAHGLTNGQDAMITGVVGGTVPDGYNGHKATVTVVTAYQFTYAELVNPGTATIVSPLSKVWSVYEILVAIGGLNTVFADLSVIPTFTSAVSYSALVHMVTGNILTVTLTPSEALEINEQFGIPYINVAIGTNTRRLYLDNTLSTPTSLKFDYVIVAGDTAIATGVVVSTSIVANGATFIDVAGTHSQPFTPGTFVAPDASLISVN